MTRRSFRLAAQKRKALRSSPGAETRRGDFEPIVPRSSDDAAVLSFGQERLWFLDQLDQGGAGYLLAAALRLRGPSNPPAFAAALATIRRRHEVLRATFRTRAGRAHPQIAPSTSPALPVVDLRRLPRDRRSVVALDLARREASRPMDLVVGPLVRQLLIRLDREDHLLVVALHHIVTDGVSTVIFLRELAQLYAAACEGRPSPLAPLAVQYADFASWQRRRLSGERLESLLDSWRQRLAGAPAVLELPTDRPRPAARSPRGRRQTLALALPRVEALQRVGQASGTTLFVALLAVFAALLQRLTGQHDLVIGTPVAGRGRREIEGLIGFFVNTLVLRADLSEEPSAELGREPGGKNAGGITGQSLLNRLKTATLGAFAHQEVPFEKLVEALKPARNLGHSPIFQVMFALEGNAGHDPRAVDIPGLEARLVDLGREVANFDLSMTVQGSPEGFSLVAEYPTDLFDDTTVRRWLGYFETLLDGLATDPERPLAELDLLSDSERAQLLEWNETTADPGELVPLAFDRQVAESPQAVALEGIDPTPGITASEITVETYADLRSRVLRLADGLRAQGVGPEVRVGLCLERTTDLVVAVLAVLEAGGCYVPLDPDHPAERLAYVQVDAGVSLVLAEEAQADLVAPGIERATIADLLASAPTEPELPRAVVEPDHLAYILYTSGSTGRPKGVQISHRALANFLASMARQPGIQAGQTVLAITTLGFDIASVELLLPLLVGAKVVLATGDEARDGQRLARRLEDSAADVMQATPATWRQLLDAGWAGRPGLLALCGGEALPAELAERLLALGVELWNLYGPTETTVWSSVQRVASAITLGRPIANTEIHVLDPGLRPVPLGVAGELHIGGLGLARGYRGRAGLTAERFVPDPFSGCPGARLYKTGDGCRRLPSGETDYLGRLDSQVKVRGFRIELGEIEAVLLDQPEVRVVAVTVRGGAGEGRLVAYVVPEPEMGDLATRPGDAQPGEPLETEPPLGSRLQSELERRLPSYMVPRQWVVLESLPLNPNGKIDRGALPDPRIGRGDRIAVAPRDAIETRLVELWSELLETEVGVEDDFFELGGHSLTATRLLSSLRDTFGVEIPLRQFFEAPRIAALATNLRERGIDPAAGAPTTAQPIRTIRRVRRGSAAGQAGKNLARLSSRVENP